MTTTALAALLTAAFATTAPAAPPAPRGPAQAQVGTNSVRLSDGQVSASWIAGADGLSGPTLEDRLAGRQIHMGADAFVVTLQDGAILRSSQQRLTGAPKATALHGDSSAAQRAAQLDGQAVEATMEDTAHGLKFRWRAVLRDGSAYVRQELTLTAGDKDVAVGDVRLIDVSLPDLSISGMVKGAPLVSGGVYFQFEDPASETRLANGRGLAHLTRDLPLRAGQSVTYSWSIGATEPGQLRRGFLRYVEQERAHPYRTTLHYNSWYDIGYFTKYDQADALDSINGVGNELATKRGVKLDAFLFDDGWDEPTKLWTFHSGFPNGFTPLKDAAARYGASPGVWMSPWGGYGKPKKARLAAAQAEGYETNTGGLVLSGPKYFARFRDVSLDFLTKYGVGQFKIDGTGNVDSAWPGGAFDSDFQAAVGLIEEWRRVKPDLYVNLTTGTYPSPAWLKYADSIWRGGEDHSFLGVGSWRQRWITYRDADTYQGVVMSGPLFPLNALMLHGIIYAQHAKHLSDDPGGDFPSEVHDYFGTGTQLQELYISHGLLKPADWDVLAEAAKWSRANADVLVDTHWVGGDPALLEVYGWAAWSPRKAILTLRNPSDKPQSFTFDPGKAFELPKGSPRRFSAHSPWSADKGDAATLMVAGQSKTLMLKPFQVLTLVAEPTSGAPHARPSARP